MIKQVIDDGSFEELKVIRGNNCEISINEITFSELKEVAEIYYNMIKDIENRLEKVIMKMDENLENNN